MEKDTNFDIDDINTSELESAEKSFQFVTEESSNDFEFSTKEPEVKDEFSNALEDFDFSAVNGTNFKKSLARFNSKIKRKVVHNKNIQSIKDLGRNKPLTNEVGVEHWANVFGGTKKIAKVIVPSDRKTILKGVSKFILAQDKSSNSLRNIGYYNGKRLEEMVLIFYNNSALDFTLSLFNPSMPLDYLYSTSLNLNDKIEVNGGAVAYTDLLFNIIANPTAVRNAKFIIAGPNIAGQKNLSLQVQNKFINGISDISPISLALQIDAMQVEGWTINFDIAEMLKRPFIPNGMDVINYKILAGNTVTMCFYYEQKSITKLFFKEARKEIKYIDRF